MNITFKQYIKGLEETAKRMPDLLKRWDNIDEELKSEYTDQIEWIIANHRQARQMAIDEGYDKKEVDNRFLNVTMSFIDMRDKILQKTGLDVIQLLNRK